MHLGLVAVLVLAAGARLLTYAQIREGPALFLHVWTQSDMHFFDRWAAAIAAGDLFTRADMRPYHERHRTLACEALARAHAGAVRSAQEGAATARTCDDAAIARTWDEWVGPKTLWQDPLYPYVLAALHATVGGGPRAVYAAQVLAGLVCVWLVAAIAYELFGATAAVTAGVLAALYGPLMFFETLRLRETMFVLCGLASVRLALAALRCPVASRWVALGVVAGASVLFKASSVLFVGPLLPLALWLSQREYRSRRDAEVDADGRTDVGLAVGAREGGGADRGRGAGGLRAVAAFSCGLTLALAPLVVRNVAVGIAPLSLAVTGPINFINGNAADHDAGGGSTVSGHAADILARTGGKPLAVVRETIATHDRPAQWVALLGRKLVASWRAPEVPNNASWPYFVGQAPWLRFAVTFAIAAPLAVLGFVVGVRRTPLALVPLLYVASGMAVCVLFYDLSRFRLPPAVGMLPFAGAAVAWLVEALRARRLAALGAGLAVVVAAAAFVNVPVGDEPPTVRLADYGVHNQISEHLARERAKAGDVEGALRLVERQLQTEPDELRAIEPSSAPVRISESLSAIAGTFAPLHAQAARLAAVLDRAPDVMRHRARAAVLRTLNAPYLKREAERSAGFERPSGEPLGFERP